jgi:hypothetical protein
MVFFGNKQQSAIPSEHNIPSSGGSTYNIESKGIETEFGKHIIKVDNLLLVFLEAFAGYMEVDVEYETSALGIKKMGVRKKMIIDKEVRMCNDKCAYYLFKVCYPLISPATTTSKLDEQRIFDNWNGKIDSIISTLTSQYFFPKLFCKDCEYMTENSNNLRHHFRVFGHKNYTKSINYYGLDIGRLPDMITTLCNMSTITYKAVDGFTTIEIAENQISTNSTINQAQQAMAASGGRSAIDLLLGRNRNSEMIQ